MDANPKPHKAAYPEPLDAIVLAGTDSNPRRMIQGQNKAFLEIGGRLGPLLRRGFLLGRVVLPLLAPGRRIVVVRLDAPVELARQPPDHLRARLSQVMDPLPHWYAPLSEALEEEDAYPVHALTQ